jgi:hypothetical protein
MSRTTTAPSPLALVEDHSRSAVAQAALALVEACHELVVSHAEGWHEGPGSLLPRGTWMSAVRRFLDDLLEPAATADGTVAVAPLTAEAKVVVETLYGDDAPVPMPDREPWSGRLLVVLGCGRSGTTWLERMLMASPDAGGVDGAESFLFKVCHPLWAALDRAAPICSREQLVVAQRRFCDTVLEESMRRSCPGARVFVEKTPLHSLIVPELAAVYPRAHYVHLVRDGRDVARSMSQIDFFGVPDPADAARLWREVLFRVRRDAAGLCSFREVRYEQLLAQPVDGVLDLLAWAGLQHDASVVPELVARAGERVSIHAGTEQSVGTGTWTRLSTRDLHRVLGECGRELVREGYLRRSELLRARLSAPYWRRRAPRLRTRVEALLRLR